MRKQLIIVAGANGVGKTTFAYQYRDEYGIDYLGADDIVKALSTATSGNVQVKAGKEFFRRLEKYFKKNQSVIIESTLSGLGLMNIVKLFKASGYLVHIIYVFLDDVELCKKRIRLRVKKGGHDVPVIEIERRYKRSAANFQKVYAPLVDTWQLFYNGFKRPLEVAYSEDGQTVVLDDEFYRIFREISA